MTTEEKWNWDAFILDALTVGLNERTFWSLTPSEIYLRFKAYRRGIEAKGMIAAYGAWLGEMLQRTKKLPRFETLIGKGEAKKLEGADLDEARRTHQELIASMGVKSSDK